ncbi:MAG: 16S rRNA (guanine(527)-N(7))-methyltransferase RsmG, partial [Desulfuromonadales bacterium]|nr:16S rRNA (guanine(527)-N(7))-methyltransferase RsmG [Desulfuromonadales bacterium]
MNLSVLLQPLAVEISAESLSQLERLTDELLRWNQRHNLTAITERVEVLEKHLFDSLTLLPFIGGNDTLLDIGSGAGFPALPLKIVCQQLEVVSVDAVSKKIAFQKHIARSLGLSGFTALHERIEKLTLNPDYCEHFSLVTARTL